MPSGGAKAMVVGSVIERTDGTVAYELNAVRTKWITKGSGEVETVKAGKAAVDRAWRDWCGAMGLVDAKVPAKEGA